MRLLNASTLKLQEFFGNNIPHYAILSHRWENEEVTYQDLLVGKGPKMEGWGKVKGCCSKAATDGWNYVWIDSCCIDKSSSAELSEAINSMFQWYCGAQICYVYLSDVKWVHFGEESTKLSNLKQFEDSRWFTRGWTLQELLAPRWVEFFDKDWNSIGTKSSLEQSIGRAARIDIAHLFSFEKASVAKRMSWASGRYTTRVEDQAYCLLGIFGVNMPPLYGEGANAFLRLQLEILSKYDDDSLFAWSGESSGGLLALSPSYFAKSGDVSARKSHTDQIPFMMTNKGLRIEASLIQAHRMEVLSVTNTSDLLLLNCVRDIEAFDRTVQVGVSLYKSPGGIWKRAAALQPFEKHVASSNTKARKHSIIYVLQQPETKPVPTLDVWVDFSALSKFGYTVKTVYPQVERIAFWQSSDGMMILQYPPPKVSALAMLSFYNDWNGENVALVVKVSEHRTSMKLDGDPRKETPREQVKRVMLEGWDNAQESNLIVKSDSSLIRARLSKTQKDARPVELVTLSIEGLPTLELVGLTGVI